MKTVTAKGKSVEEAINNALEELGTTIDRVTTKVIDVPGGGILGMLGSKYAKVEVTLNDGKTDVCADFLERVIKAMGIEADINIEIQDDNIMVKIDTAETGVIIGRRGQTLDAIQYLANLAVNRRSEEYTRVMLDVGDYREKRRNSLVDLADKVALQVEKTRKSHSFEPMNPYERRIIHSALQSYQHVKTHSEGEEPYRHIIVEYRA